MQSPVTRSTHCSPSRGITVHDRWNTQYTHRPHLDPSLSDDERNRLEAVYALKQGVIWTMPQLQHLPSKDILRASGTPTTDWDTFILREPADSAWKLGDWLTKDDHPRVPALIVGHPRPRRGASRVAFAFLCVHAVATTPAQRLGSHLLNYPAVSVFPDCRVGSTCATSFSRIAQRFRGRDRHCCPHPAQIPASPI
jgi:hypothetical protein